MSGAWHAQSPLWCRCVWLCPAALGTARVGYDSPRCRRAHVCLDVGVLGEDGAEPRAREAHA